MILPELVLFDFDGTLADSAPDLAAAANFQRLRHGLAPMPLERLRPVASHGARGLLRVALGLTPEADNYESARQRFIADYARLSTTRTQLFPGVRELLDLITAKSLRWGIVTNKATHLTEPIVAHLGLDKEAAAVVCGDTVGRAKPFPDPLLHAAELAGVAPENCVYVGDDLRDIQAAHAAGMPGIIAAYGYVGEEPDLASWEAEAIAAEPADIWTQIEDLYSRAA